MKPSIHTFYLIFNLFFTAFCCSLLGKETAARFLLITPSARSMGMGGTGTALFDDAFAAFYNPAGLSFQKPINITGSFVKPLPFDDDVEYSSLSIMLFRNNLGAFALSGNIYALGNSIWTGEGFGETRRYLGTYNSKAWIGRFSYAKIISKEISVGLSINYMRYRLTKLELSVGTERGKGITNSFFYNFGFLIRNLLSKTTYKPSDISFGQNLKNITRYVPKQGISIGLSLLNFGPKISFIDHKQADNLPSILSLGLCYFPIDSRAVNVAIATDLENQIYEDGMLNYVHFGIEYNLLSLFSIRTGYALDTYGPKNSYQTFGFGFTTKYISFDIAKYNRVIKSNWQYSARINLEI
jgi:hypothetical protein